MLRWNWNEKMGKLTIKRNGNKFNIGIYNGNCLAIFLCEYKNEQGEKLYNLYNFLADKKHCANIVKEGKRLFWDEVTSIELNLYYPNAKTLLNILIKDGYKVKAYYQEPKQNKTK